MAVAVLLAAAALLLVQQRADAAPVAAVAASIAGGDGVTAQIDIPGLIQSIVCPILLSLRNAFDDLPFFGIFDAIIDGLLSVFGCTPSP
jgi:hypothetical protein